MAKCKSENRFPSHNFPMRIFVVDEETGEETTHHLNYGNGKLTVSPVKGAAPEPEKKTADGGAASEPGADKKPETETGGAGSAPGPGSETN